MKYDFVTIGDAFEDVFVFPSDLHVKRDRTFTGGYGVSFELGEKIPLKKVEYEVGGSACNTSVGFCRLGLDASLISVMGKDTPAEKISERLSSESVDLSNVKVDKKMKTNFSTIFGLPEGRTIFFFHGLKDYSQLRIKKSVHSKWYFLAPIGDGTDGLEKDLIAKVSEENSLLAWNPGTMQVKRGASRFRGLLKNIAVLFLNREEALKFVDYPVKPNAEEMLKKLFSFGPKLVIITNGKEGARAYDGKTFYTIGALSHVDVVDATGAGDSFATGVLAKLLLCDWTPESDSDCIREALKWGIANSSSVIKYVGGQKGLLSKKEIEKTVADNPRLKVEIG
jgi:sugar/nucleoside kinase (ribokinase family)